MADLPESAVWDAGIRQIETTDPVVGGPPNLSTLAGMANVPHLQLARRTLWLKDKIDTDLDIDGTTLKRGLLQLATTTDARAGSNNAKALTPAAAADAFLRRDLGSASALTAASNLNSVTVPGLYFWQSSPPANRPAGVLNAKIIVETVGGDIVQMVWGGSDGTIHTRRRTSASWGPWRRMLSDADATLVTGTTGYRINPDGFIQQWGTVSVRQQTSATFSLPIAFPNNQMASFASMGSAINNRQLGVGVSATETQVTITNAGVVEGGSQFQQIKYLVVGN